MSAEAVKRATVQIALSEEEVAAMDYAGPRVVGPQNFMVAESPRNPDWEPIPGGEPILELYFDHDSLEAARATAAAAYAKMRAEARLPPAEPRVLGVFLMNISETASSRFIDEVYDMFDQQRYEWTVVAAQVACEVAIREALAAQLGSGEHPLARLAFEFPRNYSLMDARACEVFEALLGASPTRADCWSRYREHVQRRNNVIHRGARISRADAEASIDAMHDLLEFVRARRAAA